MQFLNFIVLVFCGLFSTTVGQWPCPDRDTIAPCICIFNEDDSNPHLELDCSSASTNEELYDSCNELYPFPDFFLFVLRFAQSETTAVETITDATFGDLIFETVDISNTNITYINRDSFEPSKDKLRSLVITNNPESSFSMPVEDYPKLEILDLNSNNIGIIQLQSSSLISIFLNNNFLTDVTLDNMDSLEVLDISHNLLTEVPIISSVESVIRYIDLSYNGISEIKNTTFSIHDDDTKVEMEHLILNYNKIETIDDGAFGGTQFILSFT